MEKAVYYTRLADLLGSKEPCDRLYFGHEFCQRLLPSAGELRQAVDAAGERQTAFTFVTPFVTNAGLKLVCERIGELPRDNGRLDLEIVVNDWGLLHWLCREAPGVRLALGRLLTKQKRGPRILNISKQMPDAAMDHFRRSNCDVPHVVEFLKSLSVARVELDNLLQGIRRNGGLPASLYHPYAYITTTRLCLMMGGDKPGKNFRSIGACTRECRNYAVTLRHEDMPVPLLVRGNTQFFRNETLPDNLEALNIDRLVYCPQIPA